MQHIAVKLENTKINTKARHSIFAEDEFNPELFLENIGPEKYQQQFCLDKTDPLLSLTQAWWTD